MASTYSPNLAIELIGSGEQSGTWGTTTNTNLGTLLEQAISGVATYVCTGGTDTITIPNGASGTARNMFLELTGIGGGSLVVPANKKLYFIYNNTSSAITVKVTGQTGVSVPAAAKTILVMNSAGTDVVNATNYFSALTLGAALPVASGGTGGSSTTPYAVYTGNSGGTGFTPIAPGSSGNVLASNGTNWASTSIAALFSGMIVLWSGSAASIPSGWVLCDGTNSTPNLVSKFVMGASATTPAVGATGGSADAVVVSHTHTITDPGHNHTADVTNLQQVATGGSSFTKSGGNTGTATTGITVNTAGVSGTNANLPPYYALCYIMKT
jgi:hypothetical protein